MTLLEFEQSQFLILDHLWSYFPNMKILNSKVSKLPALRDFQ